MPLWNLHFVSNGFLLLGTIGSFTSFGPRIIPCFQWRLIASDGRILLHVCSHLRLVVKCEEFLHSLECLVQDFFWDPMIYQIEKSGHAARIVYRIGNLLSFLQGWTVDIRDIDLWNRREFTLGCFADFAVGCLSARVEVHVLLQLSAFAIPHSQTIDYTGKSSYLSIIRRFSMGSCYSGHSGNSVYRL